MNQYRALQPAPDICCLPSPYRVLQGVAGMAFNFSKIELSHHPGPRKAVALEEKSHAQKDLITALRG
jgi:hypothetical protein